MRLDRIISETQAIVWSIPDRILSIVVIFALLGIGLRVSNWAVARVVERRRYLMQGWDHAGSDRLRTESITRVLQTAVRAGFGILAFMLILSVVGFNPSTILTSVSLVSVAVGFGAQYLVRDYLSGILILTEDQYRVGDSVEINKISGTVEDMRLRLTVLRGVDGTVHFIPNGDIRVASNHSKEYMTVSQSVTVAFDTDLAEIFAIIDRIGQEIATDPNWKPAIIEPMRAVQIQQLTGQGPMIRVIGKAVPERSMDVESEFRLRLLAAVSEAGIAIS